MKNTIINADRLSDDLFEMINNNPELLDDFLRDEGFDPIQVEKAGISKIKSLLFKYTVAMKKQQLEDLYAKALVIFKTSQAETKESILSLLRIRSPQLQFNNLEKMDGSDLKEILDETDLLDLMEKIEKKEL